MISCARKQEIEMAGTARHCRASCRSPGSLGGAGTPIHRGQFLTAKMWFWLGLHPAPHKGAWHRAQGLRWDLWAWTMYRNFSFVPSRSPSIGHDIWHVTMKGSLAPSSSSEEVCRLDSLSACVQLTFPLSSYISLFFLSFSFRCL